MTTSAITLVAGLAIYLSAGASADHVVREANQNLLAVARIAAIAVDGEAHDELVRPEQMDTPAYTVQNEKLRDALAALPDIRYVYTLRRVGTEFFFILDPTPEGDFDQDGVEDKSYLMDPVPVVDRELIEVYESGAPAVVSHPVTDPWGTFITAYAPILDSHGEVVGAVGVDRDYADVLNATRQVYAAHTGIALLCLALAVVFGGLVAHQTGGFRETGLERVRRFLSRRLLRVTLAEIGLYALVATMVGSSFLGLVQVRAEEARLRGVMAQDQSLENLRRLLPRLADPTPALNETRRLRLDAVIAAGYPNLAREVGRIEPLPAATIDLVRARIVSERGDLRRVRDEAMASLAGRHVWAFAFASIALLISMGGVVLMRHAAVQDATLREAETQSQHLQTSYSNLVESLPIGLFAYQEAGFEFANQAWRRMIGEAEGEASWAAFLDRLEEDDRGIAESMLLREAARRQRFLLAVRLRAAEGGWRHVEIHAAPVRDEDGAHRYMLAFVLDVTETVEAGEALARRNEELRDALDALEGTLESTVRVLVRIVEAKDRYTAGHSERVAAYSVAIGREMGLDDEELRTLELGGLIHDVGKIGVPDAILTKPDRLTDEEYGIVKSHPEIGHLMIRDMPLFAACAPLVLNHHERLDGSGYPNALYGTQLSLLVRILMVADAFDAMNSNRAYRDGLQIARTLGELEKDAETGKLDPEVVRIFADMIHEGRPPFEGMRDAA